jgi:hypothetical protein
MNKSLAETNKSQERISATNKCSALPVNVERTGPNSHSVPLCFNLPWPSMAGAFFRSWPPMTSDDSLSLILRRLDEIERKLDRMMEELQTPTAIGYSVRRGNLPKED